MQVVSRARSSTRACLRPWRVPQREAEQAIKEARVQLEGGGKWESRCHELERELRQAREAAQAASAEAKAVGEREQVLLHRVALRERLVHVDWSKGAEVVSELRAESARAAQQAMQAGPATPKATPVR